MFAYIRARSHERTCVHAEKKNMHARIPTYLHACTLACMHTNAWRYARTHSTHTLTYTYTHARMYKTMYARSLARTHAHIHSHAHTTHTHTHTHTHAHTRMHTHAHARNFTS